MLDRSLLERLIEVRRAPGHLGGVCGNRVVDGLPLPLLDPGLDRVSCQARGWSTGARGHGPQAIMKGPG